MFRFHPIYHSLSGATLTFWLSVLADSQKGLVRYFAFNLTPPFSYAVNL
jgi:hypothetical protein